MSNLIHNSAPSAIAPPSPVCQAILFNSCGHLFALPINAIAKITYRSTLTMADSAQQTTFPQAIPDHPLTPMAAIGQFNHAPLYWIDLEHILQSPPSPTSPLPPFVIVAHSPQPYYYGLLLHQLPQLTTLNLAHLCALPPLYRQRIAHIASHALLPQADQPAMIFLLDLHSLEQLLSPQLADPGHPPQPLPQAH